MHDELLNKALLHKVNKPQHQVNKPQHQVTIEEVSRVQFAKSFYQQTRTQCVNEYMRLEIEANSSVQLNIGTRT